MVFAYNHCQTAVTRWQKCYFGQTPEPLLLAKESSLWNLTLNLPKIPPNMHICPKLLLPLLLCFQAQISSSESHSPSVISLNACHQLTKRLLRTWTGIQRACTCQNLWSRKCITEKRGEIYWKSLAERKDFNSFSPNFVYLPSQEKKTAVVSHPVMHFRLLFYTKWGRLHIKRFFFKVRKSRLRWMTHYLVKQSTLTVMGSHACPTESLIKGGGKIINGKACACGSTRLN